MTHIYQDLVFYFIWKSRGSTYVIHPR